MKKLLLLIVFFLTISSCSSINKPLDYENIELIPKNIAVDYLNSFDVTLGVTPCVFKKNYVEVEKIFSAEINKYPYDKLNINPFKALGFYEIEIRNRSNFLVVCSVKDIKTETENKKFVSAFVSLGGKYNKGMF